MSAPMPHVTTYLCIKGADAAIDFYKQAFGAEEQYRWRDESGRLGHAEITIGETLLMLSDEWPEMQVLSPTTLGGAGCSFVLSVPDAAAAWERALAAGATVERPINEAPYGRGGWLHDPFGFRWHITTPNPDFDPAQL